MRFFLFLLSFTCITTNLFSQEPIKESEFLVVAGGCFWCIEHDLESLDGVIDVVSGFSGGIKETANYHTVSSGNTKHRESIKITYNPRVISLETLTRRFFYSIDPLDDGGQFCDRGFQYTSAIYTQNDNVKKIVQTIINEINATGLLSQEIKTKITPYTGFWLAEDYHQNYAEKNPIKYKFYRFSCGRDKQIESVWKNYKETKQ